MQYMYMQIDIWIIKRMVKKVKDSERVKKVGINL